MTLSKTITIRLEESELEAVDRAVDAGYYRSRSEAIRVGVARVTREAYERRLAESFAAAYAAQPDEPNDWGLRAASLTAE